VRSKEGKGRYEPRSKRKSEAAKMRVKRVAIGARNQRE